MKRFTVSILCVSIFFIGLGAFVDSVGARFKSDEKALALVKQARIALGGEAALNEVRSMTITGKTTNTFTIDGTQRAEQGQTEIAMQLPDKLMKMVKIGDGASGEPIVNRQVNVVVVGKGEGHDDIVLEGKDGEFTTPDGKKVIVRKIEGGELKADGGNKIFIRKADGDKAEWKTEDDTVNADGKRRFFKHDIKAGLSAPRQNELLRTTLGLLLSAPEGVDVSYIFAGEGNVDGTSCNIINAESDGSTVKIHLSKATSLPVMISYHSPKMPKVFKMRTDAPKTGEPEKDTMIFTRRLEGADAETAEFQIRFSDYRSVGGVQLPYKWTQTVGGQADQIFDVTTYELNPANIADKFKDQKVFVRKAKPVEN
ncbi:MAG: hypothetical protein H7070_14975 [Saprospiraceae bacterium]|nr:hypothetical protein [Pyrinomonadaceae bacterium]